MGSEIKFRAWDKENKSMMKIFDSSMQKDWYLPNWSEKYEVMQYTGLHDKNGVEVYEGDIVHWGAIVRRDFHLLEIGADVVVEWSEYAWVVRESSATIHDNLKDLQEYDFKVIGNIYENPELLKEADHE